MHFTASIDYGIVLTNAIVHETSDKDTVTLHAGDVIVQRGTLHAWHNRTDQWTRASASPVRLGSRSGR